MKTLCAVGIVSGSFGIKLWRSDSLRMTLGSNRQSQHVTRLCTNCWNLSLYTQWLCVTSVWLCNLTDVLVASVSPVTASAFFRDKSIKVTRFSNLSATESTDRLSLSYCANMLCSCSATQIVQVVWRFASCELVVTKCDVCWCQRTLHGFLRDRSHVLSFSLFHS